MLERSRKGTKRTRRSSATGATVPVHVPGTTEPMDSRIRTAKVKAAGRDASTGDTIEWLHFTLGHGDYTRSRDSTVDAGTGVVRESHADCVIVQRLTPTRARKGLQIPRCHVVARTPNPSFTSPVPSGRPSRRRRHDVAPSPPTQSPGYPSKSPAGATVEEQLRFYRARTAELETELQKKETARLSAMQATRDERKKTIKLQQENAKFLTEQAKALQCSVRTFGTQTTKERMEEERTEEESTDRWQLPLADQTISMTRNGVVAPEIRDLVANLAVKLGIVAHNVVRAIVMVLAAMGATVQNEPTGKDFVLRCIVERETMLFDDQVRRMAEANQKMHWYSKWCGVPAIMPIRPVPWTSEAWHRCTVRADAVNSTWQSCVGSQIDVWRNKIVYDPKKDLPDPKALVVGLYAETEEDYENAECAGLFCGVDGTTHGRNGREVLGGNVGGYRGAPPSGEFGFLTENFSAFSGPRVELGHILDWLDYVRRRQRFLGFVESALTWLYDIPVWVVGA